jgi:RING finger protein 113A
VEDSGRNQQLGLDKTGCMFGSLFVSTLDPQLHSLPKFAMADAGAATTVPFFKKSKRPTGNTRKRSPTLDQADADPAPSAVVRPVHRNQPKLLSQGTKRTVSQRVASEYDTGDMDQDSRDGSAVGVNWTGSGATKDHAEAKDILYGEEVEEMMEQKRKKQRLDRGEVDEVDAPDGLYRGQGSYQHTLGRKDETALPKAQRIGPVKSTTTIKTVTMIDYQPDVCKDYKGEHAVVIPKILGTLY